jgi:hypothetical protein
MAINSTSAPEPLLHIDRSIPKPSVEIDCVLPPRKSNGRNQKEPTIRIWLHHCWAKLICIDIDGSIGDRAKFLADAKATKYTSVDIQDFHVTAHGQTAIATMVFKAKGTDAKGKRMRTSPAVRRLLSAPRLPPRRLSPPIPPKSAVTAPDARQRGSREGARPTKYQG